MHHWFRCLVDSLKRTYEFPYVWKDVEFSFYQGISLNFNYTKITFITCFSAFWWRVLVFINLNNMFPKMNCLWCNQVSPQPPRSSKHVRRWKISYKRQNLRYCNANMKTLLFIQRKPYQFHALLQQYFHWDIQ